MSRLSDGFAESYPYLSHFSECSTSKLTKAIKNTELKKDLEFLIHLLPHCMFDRPLPPKLNKKMYFSGDYERDKRIHEKVIEIIKKYDLTNPVDKFKD